MDSFRFDKVSDPLELCRRRSGLKLAIGGDEIRAENPQKKHCSWSPEGVQEKRKSML
jgi:hypothetical protein